MLRPRRGAARVPALELPPGVDLLGTSGVQFVGYTLAVLSILGSAKVAVALLVLGVPIIDTFWIIVRRLPQGGRRSARTASTSTIGCSTWACRTAQTVLVIYGICLASALLALLLSGVDQLYAFLGVFLVSGLVLFGPTRGAFRRPEELEAETYEPNPGGAGSA